MGWPLASVKPAKSTPDNLCAMAALLILMLTAAMALWLFLVLSVAPWWLVLPVLAGGVWWQVKWNRTHPKPKPRCPV